MSRALVLAGVLAPALAIAQPVTSPDSAPALAQIRDDKQLAEVLSSITQDPSVHVDDDKARPLAQALMTEGVRQLRAQSYDQALANFLEAYNKFPSPKILLNIAATLRDMGRLADAANTYQRYLSDPATAADRVAEVKELLLKLDEQLTILTVRVFPKGSEVSIDGGPFVPVGASLLTRVRPGLHLVRLKHGEQTSETTVNGFEGEQKDVAVAVKSDVADTTKPPTTTTPTTTTTTTTPTTTTTTTTAATTTGPTTSTSTPNADKAPEKVDGWLITGTQYAADSANGRSRRVRTGYAGPEVAPIVPKYETTDTGAVVVHYGDERKVTSGVVGIMRIDGKGRGLAGGFGIAYAPSDTVELELAALRANSWGAFLGVRARFMTGWVRPYVAGGVPLWFFTDDLNGSRTAFGTRLAGGIELMLNGHLSLEADVGIEHFFNISDAMVDGKLLDETVFVPTLGLTGRL